MNYEAKQKPQIHHGHNVRKGVILCVIHVLAATTVCVSFFSSSSFSFSAADAETMTVAAAETAADADAEQYHN